MTAALLAVDFVPDVVRTIQAALKPVIHKEDDGVFITCSLAKSFGNLADHYKTMDEKMKVKQLEVNKKSFKYSHQSILKVHCNCLIISFIVEFDIHHSK